MTTRLRTLAPAPPGPALKPAFLCLALVSAVHIEVSAPAAVTARKGGV